MCKKHTLHIYIEHAVTTICVFLCFAYHFHVLMNKVFVFILLYHHVSNEKWSKSPEVSFLLLLAAIISCTACSSLLYAV